MKIKSLLGVFTLLLFCCIQVSAQTKKKSATGKKPVKTEKKATSLLDSLMLQEVTVTGQKSTIKLEVDRKTYDVSQDIANVGATASEALENIPSVEVDQDGNISLRGSTSVEVWINGKPSGLTSDNRGTILQQIPAETIDKIEVIDNPSAKFSAEGSAGIINIILKRDRKAGYYGSVQAGGDTFGGANTNASINYNSKWIDGYASVGYRHFEGESESESKQDLYSDGNLYGYQNNDTKTRQLGNMLFTRYGITLHASKQDDLSFSGMFLKGGHNSDADAPYYYGDYIGGDITKPVLTRTMTRNTTGRDDMQMQHYEFDYKHNFTDKHWLELNVSHDRWNSDNTSWYKDRTVYADGVTPAVEAWQKVPQNINNKSTEIKLDYENKFSDMFLLQAGYDGRFNREDTPQERWLADNIEGEGAELDKSYYNRFQYDMDTHAAYVTATLKFGKFGVMGGLRGEYWKVNTISKDYEQDHGTKALDDPYNKDFFKLFPSVFLTYQLTKNDQLQLNYTRRLKRPWGHQLNSFMDTRSATSVSFGNPQLTPEYSNNFALNYLRTWEQHSLLVSAYYHQNDEVMQQVRYRIPNDERTFQTYMNLTKSINSGIEITAKNKLWRIVDITTTLSASYYKLDGFNYSIIEPLYGQLVDVTGDEESQFQWKARTQISVMLPWDMSVQLKANYRSRRPIVQGEQKGSYGIDLGVRKSFFNKKLSVAINCRDLLDSRCRESETWSDTFYNYSKNRWNSRKVNFTVTWSFGNNNKKKGKRPENMDDGGGDSFQQSGDTGGED